MSPEETIAELERERARLERLTTEGVDLRERIERNGNPPQGLVHRANNTVTAIASSRARIAELEREVDDIRSRRDEVSRAAGNPAQREAGADDYNHLGDRAPRGRADGLLPQIRDQRAHDDALRAIDLYTRSGDLTAHAADRLDDVVRGPDAELGLDARYLAAVANPDYERAFGKLLRYGPMASMRMTPDEVDAVQQVNQAESVRSLVSGTGSAGGFAIPIAIDPTLTLSSNGAINPIRELATVRPMSTRELRLVTTDGVTAQYQAEASEAIDNSPVLVQPVLIAQRATCFVPFSFELDQDWGDIRQQLAAVIADSKDVLEATKFLTGAGAGSNEPVGLLSIGTTGSLTTTQRVQTTAVATFAAGDVYKLKQALPARFYDGNASYLLNPATTDVIWQFVAAGSTTQARLMPDSRDAILGRPMREWSTMATGSTTGTKLAVFGDIRRGYTIGDRLGMSLEIVPHLFGATNRYPTGQRGAYAIWRNDARVTVPNALRYLEVQ